VTSQFQTGPYNLRSGISVFPEQQKAIDKILVNLRQELPAHFLLLGDVTGQIVQARGERDNIDLVALGSLMAGDLAASQEIARLTGEYQNYQMILREGSSKHTFISEVGHHLILLVQVSNDVPLGWARKFIQRTVRQVEDIMANTPLEVQQPGLEKQLAPMLNQEDLPGLFSDALDDLWTE
jgi:predicted regulator of Ras-like GTPase activity (Roadblock/LC7/MglB family)